MFFILAVILIAIGGILFILFFDEKPKPIKKPIVDDRAIPFDQNTDQVEIVFDEPSEIQHININLNLSGNLESSNQADQIQDAETLHPESNQELTTNSKINPFNF